MGRGGVSCGGGTVPGGCKAVRRRCQRLVYGVDAASIRLVYRVSPAPSWPPIIQPQTHFAEEPVTRAVPGGRRPRDAGGAATTGVETGNVATGTVLHPPSRVHHQPTLSGEQPARPPGRDAPLPHFDPLPVLA
jgi:hypothetical protein